ncbi:MAG TPA: tetratricopeptide repeat protein [Vicinamibacterales bacterium]|nr:tetratricopeptide repeat protein [Vicinamibacterales bacterium]
MRTLFTPYLLAASLAFGGAATTSTSAHDTQHHADRLQQIPAASSSDALQRPIGLTAGAGKLHQRVTTTSADAQAYYDQGVAYLHSYVWVDAARSFHEALRRDPNLAMAYLGLAKAYTGAEAYAEALQYADKAVALAAQGRVTPKEAKWIALGKQQLEATFAPAAEHDRLHEAYKRAIDELIVMDPADAHAWVLRGNAEESRVTGRGQGGGVGSIAYYQTALTRDPHHWGADHYLIHSYEGVGLYKEAAEHGAKYAAAAPAVPHASHMYAHVLPRLGRWEEALKFLTKADAAQRAYFASSGIAPEDEWHHGHNLHLKGIVQYRLGNDAAAEQLFQEAFALPVRSLRDGRFVDPLLEFLLVKGRFDAALAAAQEARKRDLTLARFIGAVRGAEALIALGRPDEARQWRDDAERLLAQFREEVKSHPLYQRLTDSYRGSHLEPLAWQLALATGDDVKAEGQLLEHAKRFVDRKGFDGWVTGLIRLEQLVQVARQMKRDELARSLAGVLRQIDPQYGNRVGG